jgi:hypothetical protein
LKSEEDSSNKNLAETPRAGRRGGGGGGTERGRERVSGRVGEEAGRSRIEASQEKLKSKPKNGWSTSTSELSKFQADKSALDKNSSKSISSIKSKFEPPPAEDFRSVQLKKTASPATESVLSPRVPKEQQPEERTTTLRLQRSEEKVVHKEPVVEDRVFTRVQPAEEKTPTKAQVSEEKTPVGVQISEVKTPIGVQTSEEKSASSVLDDTETSQILENWRARRVDKSAAETTPPVAAVVPSRAVTEKENKTEFSSKFSDWRKRDSDIGVLPSSVAAAAASTLPLSVTTTTTITSKRDTERTPKADVVSRGGADSRFDRDNAATVESNSLNTPSFTHNPTVSSKLVSDRLQLASDLPPRIPPSDVSHWSDKDSGVSSAFSRLSEFSDLSDSSSPRSDISEFELRAARRRAERPRNLDIRDRGERARRKEVEDDSSTGVEESVGRGEEEEEKVGEEEKGEEKVGEEEKSEAPMIQGGLEDRRVRYGAQAVFRCQVSGVPEPDVSWSVNNKAIKVSSLVD